MDTRTTLPTLAVLVGIVLMGGLPSGAAQGPLPARPAEKSALRPTVILKIGDAMLEEYRGGDPARRTLILRQDEAVKMISEKPLNRKKHS